jgi:Protein of unknwon function (DUF3310)
MSALNKQVGGSHYKDFSIQPVEFIQKNGLGFCEGNAIKYLCRWKEKGGIQDLQKAIHYVELLIEMETRRDFKKESQEIVRKIYENQSTQFVSGSANGDRPELEFTNVSRQQVHTDY